MIAGMSGGANDLRVVAPADPFWRKVGTSQGGLAVSSSAGRPAESATEKKTVLPFFHRCCEAKEMDAGQSSSDGSRRNSGKRVEQG